MPLTLVIGNAMTDYYLANKLIQEIPNISIVKYDQVKIKNLDYYFKKLKRFGFLKSSGIKLLSIFLRLEIILEKISRKDIWSKLEMHKPKVPQNNQIQDCNTLEDLYRLTKESELIILTQTIRLTDNFFKNNKKIIQIIGGKYPGYCGDSAVFLATALHKESDYCFSLILRHRFFQKSSIIKLCPISVNKGDSIRLMRAKGIIAVAAELPQIISGFSETKSIPIVPNSEKPITLTTPTLSDYFSVVFFKKKLSKIPRYATNSKMEH